MSSNSSEPRIFPKAYFQGDFVPIEEAKISIMNHTFLYGTSVFEGIRAYWSQADKKLYLFRALEHFQRLKQSMKILHMELEEDASDFLLLAKELMKVNEVKQDAYLRATVYKSGERIGPALLNNKDEFCIFAIPFGDYLDTQKGIPVTVSNWRRVEDNAIPSRAKISGSYVNTALAKTDALLGNFAESILLDEQGHVTEGSAMNIFMVKANKFITTPVYQNILEGITRNTLLELIREELGCQSETRTIDRSELYTADELFFCGTGAQISPITSVDYRKISDGKPGKLTRALSQLYFDLVKNKIPKYQNWCTKI